MPNYEREIFMPDPHTGPPYPGLGLPLRCANDENVDPSDTLPVRELAMMHIMDRLTDKKDWNKKVFDEEIVAKWRVEAKAIPDIEFWNISVRDKWNFHPYNDQQLDDEDEEDWTRLRCLLEGIVNDNTFDCIIQELRSKAAYFEKTGLVPTLDACQSVVKSDNLVSAELHDNLLSAFNKLIADNSKSPDWHPKSNDMVLDLVHPSMYPLVYGQSKVYKEELVGINNAIKLSGTGEVIEKDKYGEWSRRERGYTGADASTGSDEWNDTYQWLPANVDFHDDGTVKLNSYINNLHPLRYPDVYRAIEKLIQTAIPAWNQCLQLPNERGYSRQLWGRIKSRFEVPEDADDYIPENWVPPHPEDLSDVVVNWDEYSDDFLYRHVDSYNDNEEERKWRLLRKARIPEAEFTDVDYTPPEAESLFNRFRETGLQVIVKMVSIELTPEKPDFPAGSWHVEGQNNERIRATALYYLDSENITTSELSFRMETDEDTQQDIVGVGQSAYSWLEQIWGTELGVDAICVQNYGSVETPQGRLLTFQNCFQHSVSSFSLADKTKPGHRRFIALWLVDPEQRIISTANVPPQQQDWWLDAIVKGSNESRDETKGQVPEVTSLAQQLSLNEKREEGEKEKPGEGKLPPELMDMVWEQFNGANDRGLMTVEEAKEHRLKLMEMRTAFADGRQGDLRSYTYNFCEH